MRKVGGNNSVWKPQEEGESIEEIDGVRFCSVSGKTKIDIAPRFSNGGHYCPSRNPRPYSGSRCQISLCVREGQVKN